MIQEITLRPVQTEGRMTIKFDGQYFDKINKSKVVLYEPFGVALNRELNKHTEKVFIKWFDENNTEFTLRWDDQKESKSNEFVSYLQKHPQVITAGIENPNRMGTPMFEFIDKRKKDVVKVKSLKEKNVVFNMVSNMPISDLVDVAFFKGYSAVGKSFEEIFVALLDYTNGILMRDTSRFLAEWSSPDKNHAVVVNKAIILGIVVNRGGKFYAGAGNEIVGDDVESVLAYMKTNDKLYDYVKRQVAERDVLPLDVNKEEANTKSSSFASEERKEVKSKLWTPTEKADAKAKRETTENAENDERQILKAKMKSLGISGWQVSDAWDISKMKEKIALKEKELQEV